ncbi:MAG: hypothetical protein ACFB03_01565 [Paracoccaceae bacterium]
MAGALVGAKSYLLYLAEILPAEFAWIPSAMAYVARLHGSSKKDDEAAKGKGASTDPADGD